MPIDKLDLKVYFDKGSDWGGWLKLAQPKHQDELQNYLTATQLSSSHLQKLKSLSRQVNVLALAEDWCGDVRRNVPALVKLSQTAPDFLSVHFLDIKTHPELMIRYLTNGAEAIPQFIFLTDSFVEIGHWGPRPSACKKAMALGKAKGNVDEARVFIKQFYESDKQQTTLSEILELVLLASGIADTSV